MTESKVFYETYKLYQSQLSGLDFRERAEILGGDVCPDGVVFEFYNEKYLISNHGIKQINGKDTSFAVKVVLCKYMLTASRETLFGDGSWVTFRDFKDSTPLHSYFASNTNKTIESSFAGRAKDLEKRAMGFGGKIQPSDFHDLSVSFTVLPKIPLLINFNDCDDMFPAACSILFRKDAENYLDMECLAITGTYLTGKLVFECENRDTGENYING